MVKLYILLNDLEKRFITMSNTYNKEEDKINNKIKLNGDLTDMFYNATKNIDDWKETNRSTIILPVPDDWKQERKRMMDFSNWIEKRMNVPLSMNLLTFHKKALYEMIFNIIRDTPLKDNLNILYRRFWCIVHKIDDYKTDNIDKLFSDVCILLSSISYKKSHQFIKPSMCLLCVLQNIHMGIGRIGNLCEINAKITTTQFQDIQYQGMCSHYVLIGKQSNIDHLL